MKISDILVEATPGTRKISAKIGTAKQKFSNLKSRASNKLLGTEKQRLAKQNQKKWYDAVKRKQQQNINMTDEQIYRKELYKYLSGAGKLKLSRELKRMVGRNELDDKSILAIMTKTIDDRIAAKQKVASAPGTQQPTGGTA